MFNLLHNTSSCFQRPDILWDQRGRRTLIATAVLLLRKTEAWLIKKRHLSLFSCMSFLFNMGFLSGLSSSPLQEEDCSKRYCYADEPKDDENNSDLTFCVICRQHCWFGVLFRATDYIRVCISRHNYLIVWLHTFGPVSAVLMDLVIVRPWRTWLTACCTGLVSLATLFNASRAFVRRTSISCFTLTNCVAAGGAVHLHLAVFTWTLITYHAHHWVSISDKLVFITRSTQSVWIFTTRSDKTVSWFTLLTALSIGVLQIKVKVLTSRFHNVSCSQNQDRHSQDQSKDQLHPPDKPSVNTLHTHTHVSDRILICSIVSWVYKIWRAHTWSDICKFLNVTNTPTWTHTLTKEAYNLCLIVTHQLCFFHKWWRASSKVKGYSSLFSNKIMSLISFLKGEPQPLWTLCHLTIFKFHFLLSHNKLVFCFCLI